ncbi:MULTISPECIES: type I methionyl aminopeptidase [Pseudomonadota]|jgi:methionyl aminopeptidase|uniref:Methionine aminopeptidase n=2 Tax=Bordetella hinzii TaxID=103855 RepID=A0AAN1VF59_9BORD|nr:MULTISPECIES: type I methionyl aminopeptidase [Pseudomonadota]AKQ58392.1 Methionine aminopeptidase [Bordetella hinzii]AZW16288.1 type I methionyl aminopeptidase [Bordetella hinzii]EIU1680550.1 type I methionyl aminopeptidase [Pseudomonas aeruginosa]EKS9915380.1 type I methionyl aminopeptidase [Burkholderia multivorans]ELM7151674.1 type I methionyl aminopeptidase [Pseudomonas aeruginosa]
MTKRPEEIALMAESGQLLAQVFSHLDRLNLIGMSTMQVNDLVDDLIVHELNARPASKGQYGYAYALNASRNHVVCHGVPSAEDVLQNGDIVNFDITLEKNGYIADSSKTYLVGEVSQPARRLVQVAYEAMWKGIQAVHPGATLGDVGHAIERHARRNGYSIVREYCGHGIGREMHEPPQVLHWGKPRTGLVLREGMVFTIEPMVNQGRRAIRTEDDGWTVVTRDGQLSAQFEHTVAVTESGVRVLTLRPGEKALH